MSKLEKFGAPPAYDSEANADGSTSNPTNFASIGLLLSDRINLSGFPKEVLAAVHIAIDLTWPWKIQEYNNSGRSHLIKLKKTPWNHSSYIDEQLVQSRRLICALLQTVFDHGYIIEVATNITGRELGKETMLFRGGYSLPMRQWFALHWLQSDKLVLIDVPDQLRAGFRAALGARVQTAGMDTGGYFIKFKGYPLRPSYADDDDLRTILLDIMQTMDAYGFKIYASIDLATAENGRDTWVCCSK